MSTFEARIRRLDAVEAHPGADKLELAVIGGWKAVVQKGLHKPGDLVLYLQEDSVFTDISVAEKLGIAAYLTGKHKNRIKAIRLRGILSQGIVLPLQVIKDFVSPKEPTWVSPIISVPIPTGDWEGLNLADELKIEKFEEEIPLHMAGHVRPWPSFLPHYDVESIKRPESMAAMVEGEEVVATEKLHGTNFTVAWGPGLDREDGELAYVCSRRLAIKESETNVYWRAVKKYNLIDKLSQIWEEYQMAIDAMGPASVSIHGEVVGVQDLKYGFVNGDIGFYAFDIMINGEFVNYDYFASKCDALGIPRVPEVYRGPYSYDVIAKLAQGKTTLGAGHVLEGVVVKPVKERRDSFGNRAQFKFVSEEYLLRSGGTELH